MIMRILHPDRGHIRVLGERDYGAANDRVGYLPEERGLYKQMKVRDVLRFLRRAERLPAARAAVDRRLARAHGPDGWADKKVERCRRAWPRRSSSSPPSSPGRSWCSSTNRSAVSTRSTPRCCKDAILELKPRGTTIIFSTHDMAVAEKLCDFIFMIFRGQKVLDGTLDSIQDAYGHDTIRVRTDGGAARLDGLPGVDDVNDPGNDQELRSARATRRTCSRP